mgnify:CR=1 FL=1
MFMQRRYGYAERALLRRFAQHPGTNKIWMPDGIELAVRDLILDGIIRDTRGEELVTHCASFRPVLFELTERASGSSRLGDRVTNDNF